MTFLFKTYIDSIYVDTTADEPVTITEVPLSSADLKLHGFDQKSSEEEIYDYVYSEGDLTHGYFPGNYTRFGEVAPLLSETDDKFVIYGGGDELTLRFGDEGTRPPGTARRYLVYSNGYYKDLKTAVAKTVAPLPFAAMSNFPYDEAVEHYPDDPDHQGYLEQWNTRYEAGDLAEASGAAAARAGHLAQVWERAAAGGDGLGSGGDSGAVRPRQLFGAFAKADDTGEAVQHYSANTDLVGLSVVENSQTTAYQAVAGWQSAGATGPTPGSPGSAVPPATLAKVNAQDSDYWTTSLTGTDRQYNWQLMKFQVDPLLRTSSGAQELKVTWRGYGEPTPTYLTKIYLWNSSTSTWEQDVSQAAATPVTWTSKRDFVMREFCLRCHDNAVPSGVVMPGGLINISTTWTGDKHGDAAGGGFGGSLKAPLARGAQAMSCSTCHDSHGSRNSYHFKETVSGSPVSVWDGYSASNLCLSCHQGDVNSIHAECYNCHVYGGHGSGPGFSGAYCLGCHTHGARWSHPGVGCHGCDEPPGYGGPSF